MNNRRERLRIYLVSLLVLVIVLGITIRHTMTNAEINEIIVNARETSRAAATAKETETTVSQKETAAPGEMQPTTAEEQTTQKSNGIIVFLDAGHGGKDPGCYVGSLYEKDITWSVTTMAKADLEALGYKVVTREDSNVYDDLTTRAAQANEANADIFLSIHVDSQGSNEDGSAIEDGKASGITTWYSEKDNWSGLLAGEIQKSLISDTGATDRKAQVENDFVVFQQTTMPSILIELGFMTNKEERENLADEKYQEKLAKGIADGVDQYFIALATGTTQADESGTASDGSELNTTMEPQTTVLGENGETTTQEFKN